MEYEYLLRLLAAGICGAIIGYERKNRMKEAGIRTHFVVAVGAALMMVVSKYGFADQLGEKGVGLDPSRIAAQVVSGVGFLGAGMIFMQKMTIKGLTTAAGVWATAGIGMAIGSGMYVMGVGGTLLILLAQILLHRRFNWLAKPRTEQIDLRVTDADGSLDEVRRLFERRGVAIVNFQADAVPEQAEFHLQLQVRLPEDMQPDQLLALIAESRRIKSVVVS